MPPKSLVKPLVKYFGPTMGKTTAKSSTLIDFDDIMRPIKEALAKQYGISRQELVKSGHPALQQAYADQINLWRSNPANAGKVLMVSSAGTLDPKFGIKWDNVPSIPSRDIFIQRSINRGGTAEDAASWYDDLIKRHPFQIDNRFVSDMPELWPSWNVGEKFLPAEIYHKTITIPMAMNAGIFNKDVFDKNLADFKFEDFTGMYNPDVWGQYLAGSNKVQIFQSPDELLTGTHELRHWLDAAEDSHTTTRIKNTYFDGPSGFKLDKGIQPMLLKVDPKSLRRPIQLTDGMIDLLGQTYVPTKGKQSKLVSEKISTNSEGRFGLFMKFYETYGRYPNLQEFQEYINRLSNKELVKSVVDLESGYTKSYAPNLKGNNIRKSYLTVPAVLPLITPLFLNRKENEN